MLGNLAHRPRMSTLYWGTAPTRWQFEHELAGLEFMLLSSTSQATLPSEPHFLPTSMSLPMKGEVRAAASRFQWLEDCRDMEVVGSDVMDALQLIVPAGPSAAARQLRGAWRKWRIRMSTRAILRMRVPRAPRSPQHMMGEAWSRWRLLRARALHMRYSRRLRSWAATHDNAEGMPLASAAG